MPPITLHMALARKAAAQLGQPDLGAEAGAFLLGATSPDIRVLTRQDRYSTHFFALDVHEHQDSVAGFLAEHPVFADPTPLNPPTRAWVAGYISHLVMDEEYITQVYRRLFALHDSLGGRIRANVMDRLLQFDLEREYGGDEELRSSLADVLGRTIEGIECGFIEPATLDRWRQVSLDVSQREMDWDRMRGMIANHLRMGGIDEEETLMGFLDSLPDLLGETNLLVTDAGLGGFIERATESARRSIARYLECE